MNKKFLEIWKVGKSSYRRSQIIVEEFNVYVRQGEFVSVIGHSGCGKSTVLSMVAGLTPSTRGASCSTGARSPGRVTDRGVVFQAPCLFPWMTALENVMLGVEPSVPEQERPRAHATSPSITSSWWASATRAQQASGRAVRRDAAARRPRAGLRALIRRCCCSTSRSACSTRSRASSCKTCSSTSGARRQDRADGHPRRRRGALSVRPRGDDDQRPGGQGGRNSQCPVRAAARAPRGARASPSTTSCARASSGSSKTKRTCTNRRRWSLPPSPRSLWCEPRARAAWHHLAMAFGRLARWDVLFASISSSRTRALR